MFKSASNNIQINGMDYNEAFDEKKGRLESCKF